MPSQASQVKQVSKTKQTDFSSIKDKEQLQNLAQNLTFEKFAPLPQKVSLDEFLQESHTFDNVENFIKHLQTRQDAKAREAYLNLIEPTKQNPDLIINTGDKQEFIKAFEYERNGKKEIFNIVATKENGKIVLSALPTKKIDYIKNKIKNADSIEVKQGAIKDFTTPLENKSLTHEGIIPNNPKSILESAKNQISETEALKQDFQHLQKEAQNLKKWDIKAREANEKKILANLEARLAIIDKRAEQELGRSIDQDKIYYELFQTGKINSKQLDEMWKEIKVVADEWYDAQVAKGNKEVVTYDKDVKEYHKLSDRLRIDKNMQEEVDKFKNWQKEHLHEMTDRTDEQIIAEQMKKMDKSYDEVKETLRFARRQMELRLNLYPSAEFGTNYAEFYQDGKGAIAKLIAEANAAKEAGKDFSGQVAGAFSKEIDGAEASIDLVWGKITNAQTHEGYGLAHIIDKHPEITPQMLDEIIAQGKVESKNGVYTIWYKKDDDIFKVGISQGFKGEGSNKWIITAYQSTREKDKTFGDTLFTAKQPLTNSSDEIIPQNNIRESLNDTLKEAFDIFKAHNKDEANDRLFDRVIEVASKLDVRYWEQVNPKWVNGTYTFWLNRAMVDTKLLKSNPQKATQTILHELIHGVTSRAIYAYDNGLRELLTKTQIDGITELKSLYNEVRKNNATKAWIKQGNPKDEIAQNEGKIYGLANEHEFLAELANKSFRDFLKGQNLFTRIIEAVAKIFGYVKKSDDEVATNALKEAKEVLYKIMDNHKEGFTRDFDDAYKKIDFIDFDNYKKYLAKHSERVKNHSKKKDIYLETLAKGGNGRGVTIGEAVFSRTLGVKSLDELENTPLTQALKQIINGEGINTFYSHLGAFAKKIKKENDKKIAHNLTIITGLQGFIKSGLYKELDDTYASYLLENLTNIANKDLKYRGKAINDFFAKDFADREIERLQTGNLDSLGIKESKNNARNIDIIADKNLEQGIKMENQMDNEKLKQAFGTNYADFSGKGIEAFNHLEQVKNGFVSGAFNRQDIGDIDLVWGKVWKNDKGNIEGYGLSKIIQKHPEITAQKLNDIITKGKIKMRKNEATQIFYDGHKVLLKQNWNGESLKNRWIVTAYAKE